MTEITAHWRCLNVACLQEFVASRIPRNQCGWHWCPKCGASSRRLASISTFDEATMKCYDQACFNLAAYFLPARASDGLRAEFAVAVQDAVEKFLRETAARIDLNRLAGTASVSELDSWKSTAL